MSEYESYVYPGEKFENLVHFTIKNPMSEKAKEDAQRCNKEFIKWPVFPDFMTKLERGDREIGKTLQELHFPAEDLIAICDMALHDRATSATKFDRTAFAQIIIPNNIMAVVKAYKQLLHRSAVDLEISPSRIEEKIWTYVVPYAPFFGIYLSKVMRVILFGRKVLDCEQSSAPQRVALSGELCTAVDSMALNGYYPTNPTDLYRYQAIIKMLLGEAAYKLKKEEEAERKGENPALAAARADEEMSDEMVIEITKDCVIGPDLYHLLGPMSSSS